MPRTVLGIYGNCHARVIAEILDSLPELTGQYEVVFLPNFDWYEISPDQIQRVDLLLSMLSPWRDDSALMAHLRADCARLTFPALSFEPLWPLYSHDPRVRRGSDEIGYSDMLAIRLSRLRLTREQLYRQYLETDLEQMLNLDRLLEIFFGKCRMLDRKVDIPICDYIEENFRRERLFWAYNHATYELILTLAQRILDRLGPVQIPAEIKRIFCARTLLGGFDVPIHPQVIKHYRLEWANPDALCPFYGERYIGSRTYSEFLWHYISR